MRNLALLATCFVLFGVSAALFEYLEEDEKAQQMRGFCRDLSCAPREDLLQTIKSLRSEVAEQKSINSDSNCTVCFSNPCQNGGTCQPLSLTSYRCECPDDYTGANCQTHVECTDYSCGVNADCYVQNHQINCVCQKGMSGDPRYGCSLATRTSCFNGDPHYRTFDGTPYDYQGTCPFVFSMPCTSLDDDYAWFSVKAKNEENAPRSSISTVVSTQVEMYNHTIFVDRDLHIYFDGILTHVPFYSPSKDFPQITIQARGSNVVIKNDQYVEVQFQYGQLCLTIPDVPAFRKTGALCGLAGDNDYDCTNDFRKQDGTVLNQPYCYANDLSKSDEFGDSWINHDYQHEEPSATCVDGKTMTNSSTICDLNNAKADCQAIFEAFNGTGPFGPCSGLGYDEIIQAYDGCLYDVCRMPDLKCSILTNFIHTCQYELPQISIGDWRNDPMADCPIHCPAHSVYETCVSSCPATCSEHDAPEFCDIPCTEGCACDFGYVLDNSVLEKTVCIPIQECGCTDDLGNFHPPHHPWLTDDCTQSNRCDNGTYIKGVHACPANGHCTTVQFEQQCVCDSGYELSDDGNTCNDINECDDPTSCSVDKGQGTCINTPGSYRCECLGFFDGHDCETYAPKRHCADLYVYHDIRDNGVYEVFPPFHPNNQSSLSVYCDMETQDGGWTLVGNTLENGTADKTFDDYRVGFGDPSVKDTWLGLEALFGYVNYQDSDLRLSLYRCSHNGLPAKSTECTYAHFGLLDASTGYQVNITTDCQGTELEFYDGWARWDLTKPGPPFVAYDNDPSTAHCSETFHNTGFWFDTSYRCGSANLNGIRYQCDSPPPENEIQTFLWWGGSSLNKAELLLRPAGFPNYDPTVVTEPRLIDELLKKEYSPNMQWND